MALFESYERRIGQITPVLEKYGMKTLEDAKEVCASIGIDPYTIVKETQPIAFENAGSVDMSLSWADRFISFHN